MGSQGCLSECISNKVLSRSVQLTDRRPTWFCPSRYVTEGLSLLYSSPPESGQVLSCAGYVVPPLLIEVTGHASECSQGKHVEEWMWKSPTHNSYELFSHLRSSGAMQTNKPWTKRLRDIRNGLRWQFSGQRSLLRKCEDQSSDSWHPCKWQEDYGVPPHCVIPVLSRRPSGQVSKQGNFMNSEYKRPCSDI